MSLSYCTPDGHAVTHAMQPRQLSHALTCAGVIGPSSSWPARMSRMRPRGESISSPHSTYVGHVGRQKPQCTQSSMRLGLGRVEGVVRPPGCGSVTLMVSVMR